MRLPSSPAPPARRLLALAVGQRRNADRHQLVAPLADDLETEAVKGEGLAGLRDHLRLVDHQPGDGGRLVIRQMPAMHAVEVADRNGAIDQIAARGFAAHPDRTDIVLVADLADDLLENVL